MDPNEQAAADLAEQIRVQRSERVRPTSGNPFPIVVPGDQPERVYDRLEEAPSHVRRAIAPRPDSLADVIGPAIAAVHDGTADDVVAQQLIAAGLDSTNAAEWVRRIHVALTEERSQFNKTLLQKAAIGGVAILLALTIGMRTGAAVFAGLVAALVLGLYLGRAAMVRNGATHRLLHGH